MSAVSMKLTPSSTARRTTRTPSSRSLTTRIAPKPTRRISSSPPSMKVGFIGGRLLVQRGEETGGDVHVLRCRSEARVARDVDPITPRAKAQRRVEDTARIELRMRDDTPTPGGVARYRHDAGRSRHHASRNEIARHELRGDDRSDGDADLRAAHGACAEA